MCGSRSVWLGASVEFEVLVRGRVRMRIRIRMKAEVSGGVGVSMQGEVRTRFGVR